MLRTKSQILPSHASGSQVQVNDLPLIQQGENLLYDARLLHKDLQVKTKFEDWIKRKISDFKFESGVDYFSNLRIVKHSKKPVTEYLLTTDMCKELGMLERSEVGRIIRKAFIQKEKEARGISSLPREAALFKGLKARNINSRKMYPYMEVRTRAGYSPKGSSAGHRHRYWMHFIKEGSVLYCTEEFALHLYHQRQVINNRHTLAATQPVLPLNFGDVSLLNQGGSHA